MKKTIAVLLVLAAVLMISGCAKSQGTIDFEGNLVQADENLRTSLKNVYTDLSTYNLEYSANSIFSSLSITQSMVIGMESLENETRQDLANFEEDAAKYNSLRGNAELDSISEESKRLDLAIQTMVSDFNAAKPRMDGCLKNMVTFRKFVDLGRLNSLQLEEFSSKNKLISNQIDSEDYSDALDGIDDLKVIVREIKANGEERSKLAILTVDVKVLNSWELYIDSLDELKTYIRYLQAEDYDSAEMQYTVYLKAYTVAISEGQDESMVQSLDDVDRWYQDNIRVCAAELKKYS